MTEAPDRPRSPPDHSRNADFLQPLRILPSVMQSRTRYLNAVKFALPLGALGLLVLLVIWPLFRAETPSSLLKDMAEVKISKPHYVGTDEENRPFSVAAEQATQILTGPNIFDLAQPEAEMTLEGDHWVAVNASKGRFNQDEQTLLLEGDIAIHHDEGYEFRTSQAHVDMESGTAWGSAPVTGQGPFGTIQAEGFRVQDKGAIITFTGRARALLPPGGQR